MINKKNLFILLVLSIISLVSICGISYATSKKYSVSSDRKLLKSAIFELNFGLYLYDEKSVKIEKVADNGSKLYLPTISPDNKNIAFAYYRDASDNYTLKAGIYNLSNKKIEEIKIDDRYSNQISDIEWITDTIIGVECHVNPSTSEYFVYNTTSKTFSKRYAGSMFTVAPDRSSIIYKENIPHFANKFNPDTLMINDEKLYVADSKDIKVGYPQFTLDSNKIAFVEEGDTSKRVVVADVDLNLKKIRNVKKIDLQNDVYGKLLFDDKNDVYFVNEQDTFKVNLANSTLSKQKTESDKDYEKEKDTKFRKFNTAVLNKFKKTDINDNDILGNIRSVHWISSN